MRKDPIIEEVRKAGEQIAQEAGYDVHAFFNLLREREKLHATRIVSFSALKRADRYSDDATMMCAEHGAGYTHESR